MCLLELESVSVGDADPGIFGSGVVRGTATVDENSMLSETATCSFVPISNSMLTGLLVSRASYYSYVTALML